MIARLCTKEFELPPQCPEDKCGVVIPVGTPVIIPVYSIHKYDLAWTLKSDQQIDIYFFLRIVILTSIQILKYSILIVLQLKIYNHVQSVRFWHLEMVLDYAQALNLDLCKLKLFWQQFYQNSMLNYLIERWNRYQYQQNH